LGAGDTLCKLGALVLSVNIASTNHPRCSINHLRHSSFDSACNTKVFSDASTGNLVCFLVVLDYRTRRSTSYTRTCRRGESNSESSVGFWHQSISNIRPEPNQGSISVHSGSSCVLPSREPSHSSIISVFTKPIGPVFNTSLTR